MRTSAGALGSNDMILGQVADDHTEKGPVKELDRRRQWRRGKCAPREHDDVGSAQPQFSFKVGQELPRRRSKSRPCTRREVGDLTSTQERACLRAQ